MKKDNAKETESFLKKTSYFFILLILKLDELISPKAVVAYSGCSVSHRQNYQKISYKMVYNNFLLGQANHQESRFKVNILSAEPLSVYSNFATRFLTIYLI